MTSPLGDAFITAHADTDKLAPELTRGTKKAAEEAEAASREDFIELGDKAGKTTGEEFGKSFVRDAAGRLRDAKTGKFVTDAEALGDKIGDTIGKRAGDKVQNTLGTKIGNLGKLLLPKWLQSIGIWVAALGPPALQLAAVLAPAVGVLAELIPVAIGGAAALGILKIAFKGVGQAIKDMGTPAFAKDIKSLAPAAQTTLLALQKWKPAFDAIKKSIQQAFFQNGFDVLVNQLGTILLPRLGNQLFYLSSTLGYLAASFGAVFTREKGAGALLTILNNFTDALGNAGDAIAPLVNGLLTIGKIASGTLLQRLSDTFVRISQSFGAFIDKAADSGRLENFFNETYTALHQIYVIGKDALSIVGSLLGAAGAAGGGGGIINFLSQLANILSQLNKSGALTAVFKVFNDFFTALGTAIGPLIGPLSALLLLLGKELSADLVKLEPTLLSIVQNGFVPLLELITASLPAINTFVSDLISLLNWITSNATVVKGVFIVMSAWFLGVKLVATAGWIKGIIVGFQEWTAAAWELDLALDSNPIGVIALAVLAAIALIVGLTLVIIALQKKFDIFGKIGNFFVGLYHDVAGFVVGAGKAIGTFFTKTIPSWYDSVVGFLNSLPGKIEDGLVTLAKDVLKAIGVAIGLGLAAIIYGPEYAYRAIQEAGLKILEFFAALPGEIVTALSTFGEFLYTTLITNGLDPAYDGFVEFGVKAIASVVSTFKALVAYVENHIGEIIGDITSLPGKIVALGPKLFHAGVSLGEELLNGIGSLAGKVGGFAERIFSDIVGDLNSAIREVNKGINKVGKYFPGGLPNIPQLANGAFITQPTLALIGEKNPEVVLPTDNPGRAAQLLNESGLGSKLGYNTPQLSLVVKIGDRDITDIVDTQVSEANAATAMALNFGPRGANA